VIAALAGALPVTAVARAACVPANPDIAVHGIELGDPLSTVLQLGSDYQVSEDENGLDTAVFTTTSESEILLLHRLFGDKADVFESAEVVSAEDLDADVEATVLDTSLFRTGRGVRLGMTRKDILDRFGACAAAPSETGDGTEVLRYAITDAITSDFLKAHNMPAYVAEYTFKGDRLVRFAFGFSYP
jgi:hypothetical protein